MHPLSTALAVLALCSVSCSGMAQTHQPVTVYRVNDLPPAQPAPALVPGLPASTAAPAAPLSVMEPGADASAVEQFQKTERVGDVTRELLSMQAQGLHAGVEQPMLGATATAGWQRYIDTFNHPMPEWFKETVKDD